MLSEFSDNKEDNIVSSSESELTQAEFPFLSEEAVRFVTDFYRKRGYYPVFHIITDYVVNHPHRNVRMYCMKHGVGHDGQCHSVETIGKHHGLSTGRVRHLISRPRFICEIDDFVKTEERLFKRYPSPGGSVCSSLSPWYINLVNTESIPSVFSLFAELYCHYFHYEIVSKGEMYFIVEAHLRKLVTRIVAVLSEIQKKRRIREERLDCRILITRLTGIEPDDSRVSGLVDVVVRFILPQLGLAAENELIILPQNVCDVIDECIKILRGKGHPIHFYDLIAELRRRNQNLRIKDSTIRARLLREEKFVVIGRTSFFALAEWRLFNGCMRDIIRDCLLKAHKPMALNEIAHEVSKSFFECSHKKVSSCLSQMPDVIVFEGRCYGLKDVDYAENAITSPKKPTKKPKRRTEAFQLRCKEYLDFVKKHGKRPDHASNDGLYQWFRRSLCVRGKMNPQHAEAFSALIEELKTRGFSD